MEPKKKINFVRKAAAERARQRKISGQYLSEGPSISNMYRAAQAFLRSLPFVGIGATDVNPYISQGIAPAGGKRLPKILSSKQIQTLLPGDRRAYMNAIDKITQRDAMIQRFQQDPQYFKNQDELYNQLGSEYADRNEPYFEDENGFDPELEWLEYKYGGTDSYDYLYRQIMNRRAVQPRK